MTSPNRIAANQANAKRSTGPRTPEGKARSRRNALKHGLAVPALANPHYESAVVEIARILAPGEEEQSERFGRALELSAAEVDVLRARRARTELLDRAEGENIYHDVQQAAEELATTQSELEASEEGMAKIDALHSAAVLTRIAADLQRLERYEKRATSRRDALAAMFVIEAPPAAPQPEPYAASAPDQQEPARRPESQELDLNRRDNDGTRDEVEGTARVESPKPVRAPRFKFVSPRFPVEFWDVHFGSHRLNVRRRPTGSLK